MSGARRPGGQNEPFGHLPGALSDSAFRLLVDSVQDYAIFMLDPEGRVVSWNSGAQRIKGYRAEQIIGQHFSVFYPPEDRATNKPQQELAVAATDGRLEDEGWRLRADGSRFWANVVITALYGDAGVLQGFGKVTRDLTERRSAEHALSAGRRLLAHLVEAQEAERRRIAWDVHDDSIQAMVAVGMRLQLLAGRLPDEQRAVVDQIDETVRGTISRLRNLILRLRPPGIDRHGLVESISAYLSQVVSGWGMRYSLRHDLDGELSSEMAVTVFRITQEALSNVQKHAKATEVDICLTTHQNGLLVQVTDNGVGTTYPWEKAPYHEHFGIMEMRERAETAGGWWTMRGNSPAGTVVEFWVPALPAIEAGR